MYVYRKDAAMDVGSYLLGQDHRARLCLAHLTPNWQLLFQDSKLRNLSEPRDLRSIELRHASN